MRSMIFLLMSLVTVSGFNQNIPEKNLRTEITEVTVFLNSAQIFETGTIAVNAGKTVVRVKGLSPYLDDKSIQVRGEGDFTILSVNHKLNYLNALKRSQSLDSLHSILREVDHSTTKDKARLLVLSEKLSLLHANKGLGGSSNGVSITQLKQAMDLFEAEIQKIKDEEIRIEQSIEKQKENRTKIERQLKELNDEAIRPSSEIEIGINSEKALTAKFRVAYLVSNAGWYPKYDVRVENIKKPLEIRYKAEVYQNTGSDWKNVKLRFSNGNPSQSGTVPTLPTWNLGFARATNILYHPSIYGSRSPGNPNIRFVKGRIADETGAGLPGVNVLLKGTTIGTTSDYAGNYSLTLPDNASAILVISYVGYQSQEIPISQSDTDVVLRPDVQSLSEVVVTGYGTVKNPIRIRGVATVSRAKAETKPLLTSTIENQTTVEIEVKEPYTITSNGEKMMVELKQIEVAATYEYYAVPKLDKDAFLVARIINWDQYNLLEGEANLYFEDAFVGRSILNAKSMSDTLDISLGRDKNIIVAREKNEEFCKRRSLGSNIVETRGFRLIVRNKKSQPINITVLDHIPLSIVSDITVNALDVSNGIHDKENGKITWQLKIEPQQQRELKLHYEVKYPKRERVILE